MVATAHSTRQPLPARLRFEIFKRDNFACQYCGAAAPAVVLHIDHILAVANGGDNDPMNLVTACETCNAGKSDRPLDSILTPEDPAARAAEIREQEAALRDYNEAALERSERRANEERIVYEYLLAVTGWSCLRPADYGWLMSALDTVPLAVLIEKIDAAECSGRPKRAWLPYLRACVHRWREHGY